MKTIIVVAILIFSLFSKNSLGFLLDIDPDPIVPCPEGIMTRKCKTSACASATRTCPAFPDATCSDVYCAGRCFAIFRDTNGNVINHADCHRRCPPLPGQYIVDVVRNYTLKCTNINYLHSVCQVKCPEGFEVWGVDSVTCLPGGTWNGQWLDDWSGDLQQTSCHPICEIC